jgi:hypothetical protein
MIIVGGGNVGEKVIPSPENKPIIVFPDDDGKPKTNSAIRAWAEYVHRELIKMQHSSSHRKKRGIGYTRKSASKRK